MEWVWVGLLLSSAVSVDSFSSEELLFAKLFDQNHYDKRARPVRNSLDPVHISFKYELDQIYDVSERMQTICILTSVYESWYEHRLFWLPSEYGNVTTLAVENRDLWLPDTTLYNSVEMYRPSVEDPQKVIVQPQPHLNTSLITFFYDTRHTIGCRFDMHLFPFDTQNCTFEFGSWSHDKSSIAYYLPLDRALVDTFQPNDAWTLISFDVYLVEKIYDESPIPYTMLKASLVMPRKSLYYIFNLIVPTLVINTLSSFAFFVSEGTAENRHDKLQIGITTLLSYCVLLLSVSDQIPKGSVSVPLLGIFYIIVMIQHALEMILAVHLSYPRHRKRFSNLLKFFLKRKCFRRALDKEHQQRQSPLETITRGSAVARNPLTIAFAKNEQVKLELHEENPELFCMILSILSTYVMTFVLCAVGMHSK